MSLFIDVQGLALQAVERELIQHPLVSGIVLFARNYHDPAQLDELCRAIKAAKPELLLTVDQEGGRVQRFRNEFSALPALGEMGDQYENNPGVARDLATHAAQLMAQEILAAGLDLSFAPVLDLNFPESTIIGARAFHRDPAVVSELAICYIHAMHAAGMAATGKHFPGHGFVVADSHKTLPYDHRSLDEITGNDLRPFAAVIRDGLDAVMMAHVVYSQIDPLPASFSPFWIQQQLRKNMGFRGIVFSDDLSMQGAIDFIADPTARVTAALEAGCDVILLCNDFNSQVQVLDNLTYEQPAALADRLRALRARS